MRDIKRIELFLRELKWHWERMPDLRLGQLLWNATKGDFYSLEDDLLLDMIRTYHEKLVEGKSEEKAYDGS